MPALLRLGTRKSPLALAQCALVQDALSQRVPELAEADAVAVVTIVTSGDRIVDRALADVGGKGLFTKEIDTALLEGEIDAAVHSCKDLPTQLPDGIVLAAVLPREDPRDVLIARQARTIAELPPGGTVGTASLRRQAQVLRHRPDLRIRVLRGNVARRIAQVEDGAVDATFLALAGLRRLGLADGASAVIDPAEMLPAVGQGAIAVTCREADQATRARLAACDDALSHACIRAERAMLAVLDGSCRTPIGGLAEADGHLLHLRGLVARPDGSDVIADAQIGRPAEPEDLGHAVGEALKRRAGPGFLAEAG
ncbi:MAG: hydroxymethylbilane synthase [Rhodospirillales bacterium]|nr:MAG: hydroxymethylbilane synthase [Rhodospirillales bacterium]